MLEEKTREDGKSFQVLLLTFHFHTVRARAHVQPSNIINFHGFLVITIIKFPQGSRLALSANFCAASSPLSLAAMVPDTDLQVLLIESNTGRVFRTLNEWRIARGHARLPRRGNARFLDETRLWTPASRVLGFRSWKSWDGEVAWSVHSFRRSKIVCIGKYCYKKCCFKKIRKLLVIKILYELL